MKLTPEHYAKGWGYSLTISRTTWIFNDKAMGERGTARLYIVPDSEGEGCTVVRNLYADKDPAGADRLNRISPPIATCPTLESAMVAYLMLMNVEAMG